MYRFGFSNTVVALAAFTAASAVTGVTAHSQTFTTAKYNIGGAGGTDYLAANPTTGHVYLSRGTHVMIIDGTTGAVVGDIADTPRVHGIAFAQAEGHGFTTNAGDSTLTMFDLQTNAVIQKIHIGIDGADGVWYDEASHQVLSINHSKPMGTAVVVDAKTGTVKGTIALTGKAPEGGASDAKGHVFINIEDTNEIDVIDLKAMKVISTWKIDPCDGPTGIAYDKANNRIFSGCSNTSVSINAATGKVVAQIANGDGVDALGWDATEKLMYIPAGRSGNITIVHQDTPDRYTVVATVPTMAGAKTVAVNSKLHKAYVFALEYGPAPTPAAGVAPTGGRAPRGPVTGTWFYIVSRH